MADEPQPIRETSVLRTSISLPLVPDHELIRLIGQGSYGEVWLARNALGAYRAIKVVYESSFRHKRPFEREFNGVQKFEPVSRLHDGLMDVLQVGRNDAAGYFYCVMELADDVRDGQSFDPARYAPRTLAQDLATQKRLPIQECRRIGMTIASALDFLHGRGLIHRDVKPSNIVFVNGIPKLADIGLVAEASEARSYVGTEGFIPPEGPGTVQSDIYSLGKVLYEISTGKDRHEYPELPAHLEDAIQENDLFEFNRIVMRACRTDASQRYRSAKAMAADLMVTRADGAAPARRNLSVRKAAAVLLLLGVIGVIWTIANHPANRKLPAQPSLRPPVQKASRVSPAGGLVAYWPGENDTVDQAGVYDGEAMGGLKFAPGRVGQAFSFETTNAALKIAMAPGLNVGEGEGLTLAAWINPMSVTVRGTIFEWNDGNGIWGAGFYVDPFWHSNEFRPGAMQVNLLDTQGNWHQMMTPPGVLTSNTFQHVAFTYDNSAGVAKIYHNGRVVLEKTVGRFRPATASDLYLGWRASAEVPEEGLNFAGLIDEPAIFDRALSADELRRMYDAAKPLPGPAGTTAPLGLVSWWRGEDDGSDSVSGNNGTVTRGAAFENGRVGRAFRFTGSTNSYVRIPDSPSLRLTNQLTIECWIKRQKPFMADFMINKGGSWERKTVNYGFAVSTPRFKNMLVFTAAGSNRGAPGISDERWHHCAVTVKNGDKDPVFYLDGVRQPVIHSEGSPTIWLSDSAAPATIGAEIDPPGGWSYYGNALIDELSLYDRILPDSEIEALYLAGRAGKITSSVANAAP
jgi:protein kinase-like protein/concanavalin A-like lectin/glucanase superfamily protein